MDEKIDKQEKEKFRLNDKEWKIIEGGCSYNITSVLNFYKLGKKIFLLLPERCRINLDNKWDILKCSGIGSLFEN